MTELLLTQNIYDQLPANPAEPLAPAEILHTVAENPADVDMMNRLDAAAHGAAAAKQASEVGVGRGNGQRSEELQTALRTLGQTIEEANAGPNRSQSTKLQSHLAALSAVDRLQSAEHGETPGHVSGLLSRVGSLAVMQSVARHARTWSRVYRGVGVGLGLAAAGAAVATGGLAAIPAVAVGAGIRAARGAVVGAGVGVAAERAAREQRNTSEAIDARNAGQERDRNDFMLKQIKRIVGRPEDEHMSSDELAAHVDKMVPDQYHALRESLINRVVETSSGLGDVNTQRRREAAQHGATRGAVGGLAAGGVSQIVPGLEHIGHHAASGHDAIPASGHDVVNNGAQQSVVTPPTPEQIHATIQNMQEHANGLMHNASTNYPDQGTLWATVQDHGAGHGVERLSDAATEKGILTGYADMHTNGFDVHTSGLSWNPDANTYTPNGNLWSADITTPKDGTWLVDGNTTSYIPGGTHLNHSQIAAIIDAKQHGAHFETPAAVEHDLMVSVQQHDAALNAAVNAVHDAAHNTAAHAVSPSVGHGFELGKTLDSVNSPWSWGEDIAVSAAANTAAGAISVERARTEVTRQAEALDAEFNTARTDALNIVSRIVARQTSLDQRTNVFAEAVFAHDSQIAKFLTGARARGLNAENQAEQELLTALELTMSPEQLRQYLGETFTYRRELAELSIDLAGGTAGAALANVNVTSPEAVARLEDLMPMIPLSVSRALNSGDEVDQQLFLNALEIDNLDVPALRERVASYDVEQLALQFARRTGGRPVDTNDPHEIALRITDLYENEFLSSPRGALLAEVSSGTADILAPIVDILNISEVGGNPIDPRNLYQEIEYRQALQGMRVGLAEAGGTPGVLANVDVASPEGIARLTNLMPRISSSVSAALDTDDEIHQELLLNALRIDNLDVPTLRLEIAMHDRHTLITEFTASEFVTDRGGTLSLTSGDPAEQDARIAAFYDSFSNNPRRRMLLDIDSDTADILMPVVDALKIIDLDGGGLTAEQALHRELSIRDIKQNLEEPGGALRPEAWVSDLLPKDADFEINVVDRLQDLRSNISAGELVAAGRWQSGQSIVDLLNIKVDLSNTAEADAFWRALEPAYGLALDDIDKWEDVISKLPARP